MGNNFCFIVFFGEILSDMICHRDLFLHHSTFFLRTSSICFLFLLRSLSLSLSLFFIIHFLSPFRAVFVYLIFSVSPCFSIEDAEAQATLCNYTYLVCVHIFRTYTIHKQFEFECGFADYILGLYLQRGES